MWFNPFWVRKLRTPGVSGKLVFSSGSAKEGNSGALSMGTGSALGGAVGLFSSRLVREQVERGYVERQQVLAWQQVV